MTYLFIADLHLSPEHPKLIQGFLDLLQHYQDKNTQLYILGDWFNAWIGDDYQAEWLQDIVDQLKVFHQHGNQIYFQVGNRDFALGEKFLNQFNAKLLPDTLDIQISNKKFRIEHGDALCTDDVAYQRFRKIIRNPILIFILKRTPLQFRQKLANGFRKKSHDSQKHKTYEIMDVNQTAVRQALADVDILIHGHTHRPEIHQVEDKLRIVLGDWREKTSEAMLLKIDENAEYQFIKWSFA